MKYSFFSQKQHLLLKGAILLSIFTVLFVVWIVPSRAIVPFGGTISSVRYCPCSGNLVIDVVHPTDFFVYELTYQPGVSRLNAFYQIFRPGPKVLGTYVPGGACLMFIPYGCAPMATPMGTIDELVGVGTSL